MQAASADTCSEDADCSISEREMPLVGTPERGGLLLCGGKNREGIPAGRSVSCTEGKPRSLAVVISHRVTQVLTGASFMALDAC